MYRKIKLIKTHVKLIKNMLIKHKLDLIILKH